MKITIEVEDPVLQTFRSKRVERDITSINGSVAWTEPAQKHYSASMVLCDGKNEIVVSFQASKIDIDLDKIPSA